MIDNRKELLLQGRTCVCNQSTDKPLMKWAEENGIEQVYIGRAMGLAKPSRKKSPWHNPYKVGKDAATNDEACEMYRDYLLAKPDLLSHIEELRGKLLVCWCYPEPCHGNVLIELLNRQLSVEDYGAALDLIVENYKRDLLEIRK